MSSYRLTDERGRKLLHHLLGLDSLSEWQALNLRAQWVEVGEPWRVECDVIALLRPPLNRQHNQSHPFYAEVGRARDAYRTATRANRR